MKHKQPGKVCQNCANSNNKKGKFKKTIFSYLGKFENGKKDKRHWYIFCVKDQKFEKWDKRKKCYQGEIY